MSKRYNGHSLDKLKDLDAAKRFEGSYGDEIARSALPALIEEVERLREALMNIGSLNRSRDQLQEMARAALQDPAP